jgi:hypothetical protein
MVGALLYFLPAYLRLGKREIRLPVDRAACSPGGGLAADEEDYLDVLSDLVEKYEDEHYPIEPVSGLDALWHLV